MEDKKKGEKPKDTLLARAKRDFKKVQNADQANRSLAIEDLRFVLGGDEQWDATAREMRKGRPMLTINKLPKFIRQLTGDQRQGRPSVKVRPVDSQADPMLAKILEGHIRNIEYNSQASEAYDKAFKHAAAAGYPGSWRINTEYSEDDSFDQDICISPIYNQFTVYYDPESVHDVYRGKLRFCFVTETLSEEEFEAQYGKEAAEWEQSEGEGREGWYLENQYRVAEYWYREPIKKTIYLLATGESVDAAKVKDVVVETPDGRSVVINMEVIPIIKERTAEGHRIMWAKVCGSKVLEGPTEWAGKYIPIIPVFGDTWVIEGETHYKSLIRDAKDPQKLYNYMLSQNAEAVALSPKVPFKLTPKQLEGHDKQWNNLNNTPYPYVLYNPDPQAPGAPQREGSVGTNPGLIQLAMTANDDMKDATGIYDASLGQRSNEQSGKAIIARQKEGDVSTFEFHDNLTRAIQFTGKVLVDLIPKIYDTERTIRVLGPDNVPQQVTINKEIIDPATQAKTLINDITVGKYDVFVTVGPSYTTLRMETAEAIQGILQVAPITTPILLPRLVKLMDWPDAEEVSQELKQMFTPQQPQLPGQPGPGMPMEQPGQPMPPEMMPPGMPEGMM